MKCHKRAAARCAVTTSEVGSAGHIIQSSSVAPVHCFVKETRLFSRQYLLIRQFQADTFAGYLLAA